METLMPHQEAALRFARAVQELPATRPDVKPRALFVGGYVRDQLLNLVSKDVDVEVFGVEAERVETLLESLFPGRVNAVGRSFGILKVHFDDGYELDVSIPRKESKRGQGHKGFLIESDPFLTFEEAARRRDFTVNSISQDPLTQEIIDPFHGQDDLRERVLRVTDPETFQDDPLRVYRAVQLSARFGFSIEGKTMQLMKDMVVRGDLRELSPERITDEWKKLLLRAEKPSVGFTLMRDLGIIERDYPELQALIGTVQEPEWHPEGDVWIHTLMVIDAAAKIIRQPERGFDENEQLMVMLSALCHDLGKPSTTKMGEKHGVPRIRSLGHEEAGEEPTRSLLSRLSFASDVQNAAITNATQHLKPGMLNMQYEAGQLNDETYANAVRKLLKKIYPMPWQVMLASSEADYRGRGVADAEKPEYRAGERMSRVIEEQGLDQEPIKPLLRGEDVMTQGIPSGPEVGRYIQLVEDARDEGRIKTREEALEYLKMLLQQ